MLPVSARAPQPVGLNCGSTGRNARFSSSRPTIQGHRLRHWPLFWYRPEPFGPAAAGYCKQGQWPRSMCPLAQPLLRCSAGTISYVASPAWPLCLSVLRERAPERQGLLIQCPSRTTVGAVERYIQSFLSRKYGGHTCL